MSSKVEHSSDGLVDYEFTEDETWEVYYDGRQVAGIEPGNYDARGRFDSMAAGFNVSHGPMMSLNHWEPTMEGAHSWIEAHIDDLADE